MLGIYYNCDNHEKKIVLDVSVLFSIGFEIVISKNCGGLAVTD